MRKIIWTLALVVATTCLLSTLAYADDDAEEPRDDGLLEGSIFGMGGYILNGPGLGLGVGLDIPDLPLAHLRLRSTLVGYGDSDTATYVMPALLLSGELRIDIPLPKDWRVGPFGAYDVAILSDNRQDCSEGDGCRYGTYANAGPIGITGVGGAGVAAYRPSEDGVTYDLSFGISLYADYDSVIPLPRVEAGATFASGWRIGVFTTRYAAALMVGRR